MYLCMVFSQNSSSKSTLGLIIIKHVLPAVILLFCYCNSRTANSMGARCTKRCMYGACIPVGMLSFNSDGTNCFQQ